MLKFLKWLLIITILIALSIFTFAYYQLKQFQVSFAAEKPLEIQKVEFTPEKSIEVSSKVRNTDTGFINLQEDHLEYIIFAFFNHPDIQAELNKETKPLEGYEDEWNIVGLDNDVKSNNFRYDEMKVDVLFTPGYGRISITAPYKNKSKHINLIIRFKAQWPAQPGEVRIESLRLGDKNIFEGGLIGEKIKEGVDEMIDREILRWTQNPAENPLTRLEIVKGAARFKLQPKTQREMLRFIQNLLKGETQRLALPR
ncbi:hypothetical protein KKF91_02405 [Myxococcota bacterium]|nr:hypothetical protein [Myxococcota bacterium]MBU1429391.1 hypothetical protein [Myxococcota bacterium]MBU1896891.1 hypothetical protein [Myxococcota bacterium]